VHGFDVRGAVLIRWMGPTMHVDGKPFSSHELLTRVRALLRRAYHTYGHTAVRVGRLIGRGRRRPVGAQVVERRPVPPPAPRERR
jgi:hypothetical protein